MKDPSRTVVLAGLAERGHRELSAALEQHSLCTENVRGSLEALRVRAKEHPAALLIGPGLDIAHPGVAAVLEHALRLPAPMVVLAEPEAAACWEAALRLGVEEVLRSDLPPAVLASRLHRRIGAQRHLHRQREQLLATEKLAALASWEIAARESVLRHSGALPSLLGIDSSSELHIETVLECLDHRDRERLRERLDRSQREGIGFRLETRLSAADPIRSVEWHAEALPGAPSRIFGTVQDVTSHARIRHQARFLAEHDELTGLPNRSAFIKRLERAIEGSKRAERTLGLLFLDLDDFKAINDTLGHAAGDALLRGVSERLLNCVRSIDVLARLQRDVEPIHRLGGDEFTVLLSEINAPEDAAKVAERILEALRDPISIENHELTVRASIGLTLYPHDGQTAGTLLRNADIAMYEAKKAGRNQYRYFSNRLGEKQQRQLAVEGRLRRALEARELGIYYQPQADIASGRISGVEALVRWIDPVLGFVSPAELIPVAESSGVIVDLGLWMLEFSCRQAMRWRRAGLPHLHLAVNTSPLQIRRSDFAECVNQILFETGFPGEDLVLEITENVFSHDPESAAAQLRELRRLGPRIALDDFGTGYCSLSYLKRFPVDLLKIDRSFVRDMAVDGDDAAITVAMISMAKSLGIDTVAEGVETEQQRRMLAEAGCGAMQGFLLSRPLPPDALEALVRAKECSGVEGSLGHSGAAGQSI